MPPKAKVKAKAKAKGKAKAKAKARPMRVARGQPAPMAAPRVRRGRGRGVLRRPAGNAGQGRTAGIPKTWAEGATVQADQVRFGELLSGGPIVVEQGSYFHLPCQVAGKVLGVASSGDTPFLRLKPTGTTHEGILHLASASPNRELRIHLCSSSCNQELVGEDILHAIKIRKMKGDKEEAPWTGNLEQVVAEEPRDDLQALRRQGALGTPGGTGGRGGGETPEEDKEAVDKKKKKKSKKKKKDKKEKGSSESTKIALDGSQARKAAVKKTKALFAGGGLDPKEGTGPSGSTCKELLEEKERQGVQFRGSRREQQQFRDRRGRSSRSPVQSIKQSQTGKRDVPRGVGRSSIDADGQHPASECGRGVRRSWSAEGHCHAVLSASPSPQSISSRGSRIADPLNLPRRAFGGTGVPHLRSHCAAAQISGADNLRVSLDSVSNAGSPPSRGGAHCGDGGAEACPEGHLQCNSPTLSSVTAGWESQEPKGQWEDQRQERQRKIRRQEPERRKRSRSQRRCQQEKGRECTEGVLIDLLGEDAVTEGCTKPQGNYESGLEALSGAKTNPGAHPLNTGGSSSEEAPQLDGLQKGGKTAIAHDAAFQVGASTALDYGAVCDVKQMARAGADQGRFISPIPPPAGPTGLATGDAAVLESAMNRGRFDGKDGESLNLVGKCLGSCGHVLLQKLLEVIPLRSKTKGKREKTAIFPLPTSRVQLQKAFPELSEDEVSWTVALCVSLNSFWGGEIFFEGVWNRGVQACMKHLVLEVKLWCATPAVIPTLCWKELFDSKGVDYRGEEVKVARWFKWSNVGPALPKEVGKVPLQEVCTLGSKHYVEFFDQYLKPQEEWTLTPSPRVMVTDDDWPAVCQGLVQAGVCTYILEEDVFEVGSCRLLNGMFGVSKEEFTPEGVEIYRLIMNLIPLNSGLWPVTWTPCRRGVL